MLQDVQLGFRRDTGRFISNVPDHLETIRGRGRVGNNVIKAEPSKESTLRMMTWCMLDDGGDRDTSILAMPRIASHPWLKYWSGLG